MTAQKAVFFVAIMARKKAAPIQKPFKLKPIRVKRTSFKIPQLPRITAKRIK